MYPNLAMCGELVFIGDIIKIGCLPRCREKHPMFNRE